MGSGESLRRVAEAVFKTIDQHREQELIGRRLRSASCRDDSSDARCFAIRRESPIRRPFDDLGAASVEHSDRDGGVTYIRG